jgi:hypothetical protein
VKSSQSRAKLVSVLLRDVVSLGGAVNGFQEQEGTLAQ